LVEVIPQPELALQRIFEPLQVWLIRVEELVSQFFN